MLCVTPNCFDQQEQLTDRQVTNLNKDWNDGTTIAALVDGMAPGLCPEYAIMAPETALNNATHAMKLADEWLGVPQVRSLLRVIVVSLVRVCDYSSVPLCVPLRNWGINWNKVLLR